MEFSQKGVSRPGSNDGIYMIISGSWSEDFLINKMDSNLLMSDRRDQFINSHATPTSFLSGRNFIALIEIKCKKHRLENVTTLTNF